MIHILNKLLLVKNSPKYRYELTLILFLFLLLFIFFFFFFYFFSFSSFFISINIKSWFGYLWSAATEVEPHSYNINSLRCSKASLVYFFLFWYFFRSIFFSFSFFIYLFERMCHPRVFASSQILNGFAQEGDPVALLLLVVTREVEVLVVAAQHKAVLLSCYIDVIWLYKESKRVEWDDRRDGW